MGVGRQLLETILVMCRLGGFAESDLIDGDDAIAGIAQDIDGGLPGGGAEILAMQQRHRADFFICRSGSRRRSWASRPYIHVSHFHRFALAGETEHVYGKGIVEAFQSRAIDGAFVGKCWRCRQQEQENKYAFHGGREYALPAKGKECDPEPNKKEPKNESGDGS